MAGIGEISRRQLVESLGDLAEEASGAQRSGTFEVGKYETQGNRSSAGAVCDGALRLIFCHSREGGNSCGVGSSEGTMDSRFRGNDM